MDKGMVIPLEAFGFGLAWAYWTGRLRWAAGLPSLVALVIAVASALRDPAWILLLVTVIAAPVAAAGISGALVGRWLRGRIAPTQVARQWVAFSTMVVVGIATVLASAGPMLDVDFARSSGEARRYAESHPEVLAVTGKVTDARVSGTANRRSGPRSFEEVTFTMTGERAIAFVTVAMEGSTAAPRYALKAVVPASSSRP